MNGLIICSSEEKRVEYVPLLKGCGINDISFSSGENIRQLVTEKRYDVIISVLPFGSGFGLDRVAYISGNTDSEQVVFAPSKVYDEICSKTVGLNISILPKNVPAAIALNTVRRAAAVKKRLDEAKSENDLLRREADEAKLVFRAKAVLIEYLKLSESDAHRFIQKRAMDRQTTLAEAAGEVLKTYDYSENKD
ncbi:MAG: ANTAR domain-containing protein [Oscillospiraceae bacterium]|nr:ANTAR domain-containing protein [Oscillospiraceae bacterium]